MKPQISYYFGWSTLRWFLTLSLCIATCSGGKSVPPPQLSSTSTGACCSRNSGATSMQLASFTRKAWSVYSRRHKSSCCWAKWKSSWSVWTCDWIVTWTIHWRKTRRSRLPDRPALPLRRARTKKELMRRHSATQSLLKVQQRRMMERSVWWRAPEC